MAARCDEIAILACSLQRKKHFLLSAQSDERNISFARSDPPSAESMRGMQVLL